MVPCFGIPHTYWVNAYSADVFCEARFPGCRFLQRGLWGLSIGSIVIPFWDYLIGF